MYPSSVYVARRAPSHGCRALRHAPSRQLSNGPGFFPPAPFWGVSRGQHPFFGGGGRGRHHGGDVFDHFDEFVNRSFEGMLVSPWGGRRSEGPQQQVWQPKFDVSEVDDAYQLHGEIPGVEAQNLDVQFTDEKTLTISGKTVSERTEGTPAQQQAQPAQQDATAAAQTQDASVETAQPAAAAEKDDAASVHSESSYVRPSVEDEADATARENGNESATETAGAPTPATDNTVATQQTETAQQVAQEPQGPHYWVSERSTGSFQRTFTFPGRIDTDNVSASLKNGVLDIIVPKAKAPEARRIQIQ